jgi:hypothetical protein
MGHYAVELGIETYNETQSEHAKECQEALIEIKKKTATFSEGELVKLSKEGRALIPERMVISRATMATSIRRVKHEIIEGVKTQFVSFHSEAGMITKRGTAMFNQLHQEWYDGRWFEKSV